MGLLQKCSKLTQDRVTIIDFIEKWRKNLSLKTIQSPTIAYVRSQTRFSLFAMFNLTISKSLYIGKSYIPQKKDLSPIVWKKKFKTVIVLAMKGSRWVLVIVVLLQIVSTKVLLEPSITKVLFISKLLSNNGNEVYNLFLP